MKWIFPIILLCLAALLIYTGRKKTSKEESQENEKFAKEWEEMKSKLDDKEEVK